MKPLTKKYLGVLTGRSGGKFRNIYLCSDK